MLLCSVWITSIGKGLGSYGCMSATNERLGFEVCRICISFHSPIRRGLITTIDIEMLDRRKSSCSSKLKRTPNTFPVSILSSL